MRSRGRYLLLTVAAAAFLGLLPAVGSSSEPSPTVDAVNVGVYTHYWSPEAVAVNTGGVITIRNTTTVPHGVHWISTPATPVCSSGVPVGTTEISSGKEWSGTCTFTHAGTYTFYCTVHGPAMSGTVTVTTPGAPTLATGTASAVGQTEATLNGTVNPQGKATSYSFNYGKTASYGESTGEESAEEGSANKPVSAHLGSLSPGTTYHYQLVAKNAAGTTEGVDRTFTTVSPPGVPSASTGQATALGETLATLNGTVNPNGQATTYLFEWGTSGVYGQSSQELPAGEDRSGHAETATLTGLAAGTVYHFRLMAKNASGTTPGADQTFTTTSPPAPTTTTTPAPTATQSSIPAPVTKAIVTPPPSLPIVGAPLLRSAQHGAAVVGSLDVSADGAGGRLEVDLFARGTVIAKAAPAAVLVGRLIRGSVSAGKVSFAVKLDGKARSALKRHRSLRLTVKITLRPKGGRAASVTRVVVVR
jgi:plastocyanin